jgi:AsmA protein
MRRLLKYLLGALFAVIVAAGLLPFVLPLDIYKKEISQRVKTMTGRDLVIGGNIKFSILPALGIELENASFSNPEGFSEKQMLQVKRLVLNVEVLPLFSKEIRIKSFILDKPMIALEVNAGGKPNWEFSSAAAPEASTAAAGDSKKSETLLAGLMLGDVEISDGQISYHDQQTKKTMLLAAVNVKATLSNLSQPFNANGDAKWNDEKVAVKIALDQPDKFLGGESSPFSIDVKSSPVTLHYEGKASQASASGPVKLDIPSLPKLSKWTGGTFAWNGATPLSLAVSGGLDCSAGACALKDGEIALDDIKAKGNAKASFSGKPAIEAAVAIDALNLNPYLAKKHASASWLIAPAMAMEPWSADPIDLSALRTFDAAITIRTGSILYDKIKLGKSSLSMQLNNGLLKASVPEAEFYGGKIATGGSLSADGAFTKQATLTGVKAEPFLIDATDSDRFSGTLNMNATVSGKLSSVRGLVESLGGNGSVKITDGAIKGVDLASMLRNVQSAFKDVDTKQKKTDFSELGGTFTITHGIVSNSDLSMKAPLLRLSGKGTVDLPQQAIHYRLTPEIVATAQGQGGKEKQGLQVPVIIEGSLDNPRYAPDLAGMVQQAIDNPQAIKDTAKSLKDQIKGSKGGLKDLLKGLKAQ